MSGRRTSRLAWAAAAAILAAHPGAAPIFAEASALKLRATRIGAGPAEAPLTIDVFRWSTDAERAPLIAALTAPPPAPVAPAPAGPARGRGGRAGGRGGRGAAPPPTPQARLTAAIKAAPTIGFVWGESPTGYSIKYGWHALSPDGRERVVLVTDRRLGAHAPAWPQPSGSAADADFTVIELWLDAKGTGEAKSSLASAVIVDAAAKTLALEGYAAAPALLEVRR
jgi:hypothetical protein